MVSISWLSCSVIWTQKLSFASLLWFLCLARAKEWTLSFVHSWNAHLRKKKKTERKNVSINQTNNKPESINNKKSKREKKKTQKSGLIIPLHALWNIIYLILNGIWNIINWWSKRKQRGGAIWNYSSKKRDTTRKSKGETMMRD